MEKILNWVKEHKLHLIIGAGVIVLLAAAFWYGSGSPDSKGFSVAKTQEAAEKESKAGQEKKASEETIAGSTDDAISAGTGAAVGVLTAQKEAAGNQNTGENISSNEDTETAAENGQNQNSDKVQENSQQPSQSFQTESGQSMASAGNTASSNTGTMVINPDTGKDQYQTDPVPEGKPEPVEPEPAEAGADTYHCTISISCATILDNMDMLDKKKVSLVPDDGWILKPVTVAFQEGESVFDVLQRVCREKKIHMEFSMTPMYNSAYIEGIHNLYEFDVGSLSGWNYKVNDWFPNYGCSRYQLKDGDVINWMYTCNLGKDVGGSNAAGQ